MLRELPPQRIAVLVLAAVILGYGVLAIVGVLSATRSVPSAVLGGVAVVALLALQLGYISRPDRRPRPPGSLVALAAQAVLVLGPAAVFGPVWFGFPGLLAGSALLLLPLAAGFAVFVAVVAALVALAVATSTGGAGELVELGVYVAASTTTAGLAVFGLSTLVRLVVTAQATRDDLERAAVAAERVRFARALHDVLAESLSAVALRCALAARLVGEHTARARGELTLLLEQARATLADARALTRARERIDPAESDTAPATDAPAVRLAPVMARALLAVVLLDFGITAVAQVDADGGPAVATAAVRAVSLVLVVGLVWRAPRLPLGARLLGLAVLVALAFASPLWLGGRARGMEYHAAGLAPILLSALLGGAVAVLLLAASVILNVLDPPAQSAVATSPAYFAVGGAVVCLIVYGLCAVARLVGEVDEARTRLRWLAVVRERARLGRDTHDLLGLGLTTITVKCELAARLAATDAARARDELGGVLETARRALVDVRAVTEQESTLSLATELRTVGSALEAAGIEVRADVDPASVADGVADSTLATVLREGVTNVLRHSTASWCEIAVSADGAHTVLVVRNDGVAEPVDGEPGRGLVNMTARVRALGGDLDARVEAGVHALVARVASPPARPREPVALTTGAAGPG